MFRKNTEVEQTGIEPPSFRLVGDLIYQPISKTHLMTHTESSPAPDPHGGTSLFLRHFLWYACETGCSRCLVTFLTFSPCCHESDVHNKGLSLNVLYP